MLFSSFYKLQIQRCTAACPRNPPSFSEASPHNPKTLYYFRVYLVAASCFNHPNWKLEETEPAKFIMKGCFGVNYTVSHVSEEDVAFLHNDTGFFFSFLLESAYIFRNPTRKTGLFAEFECRPAVSWLLHWLLFYLTWKSCSLRNCFSHFALTIISFFLFFSLFSVLSVLPCTCPSSLFPCH